MMEKGFKKGEVIFSQGEEGNSFFRILDGSVGIYAGYQETGERKLAELGKDRFFGEMAIIESYPRSASAVSLSDDTKVKEIAAQELMAYLEKNPDQLLTMIRLLGGRLKETNRQYKEVSDLILELRKLDQGETEKSEPEKRKRLGKKIRAYVEEKQEKRNAPDPLTAEYGHDLRVKNHSEGFSKKVQTFPKGTVICREGMTVHCMYDIYSGKVGVYSGFGTDQQLLLAELYPNSFFGEAGMVSDEPRSATAVALEDTTAEIIYPEDLEELLEKNPFKVELIVRHLSGSIRRTSRHYLEACALLEKMAQEEERQGRIPPELAQQLQDYKEYLYD